MSREMSSAIREGVLHTNCNYERKIWLKCSSVEALNIETNAEPSNECEVVVGMRIGRGNRSTLRKPSPLPLCPLHILHDLRSNLGHRGGKPSTNRLSCGTAHYLS
jgi:hypothetical protein